MSLDNKDLSLFCVYMHTNQINNKRYVGITNQKPSYRWRTDGSGYKHQMFGRAITSMVGKISVMNSSLLM